MTRARTIAVAALLGALAVAASVEPAQAQAWHRYAGAGQLELDFQVVQREEGRAGGDPESYALAGLGMRFFGGKLLGLVAGIDARLAARLEGGFSYDAALLPAGVGVRAGTSVFFGLASGVAISGITDRIGFAVELPVEARLHLQLGRRVHLAGWGRVGWIGAEGARQSGSELGIADELRAGLSVRLGRGGTRYQESWSNGVYLGAVYLERMDERELGLVLGYGISAGYFPRRR